MGPAIVLILFIGVLILLAQLIQKRGKERGSLARKILHIGAITVCAISVYIVPDQVILLWIVGGVIPILVLIVQKGFFLDPGTGRKSWGILYFALVYFVLLFVFADSRPEMVYYPMLVLAWSDGLATIIGERWGLRRYKFSSDGRSVEGSTAFFLSALVVLFGGRLLLKDEMHMPFEDAWVAVFVAGFLSLTESVSSRGRDNLWVPLFLAYWMLVAPDISLEMAGGLIVILIPLGAAVYAFRAGWLQAGGAVAALLMGWIMLVSPESVWILPALVFFVVGSILTKLPRRGDKVSFGNRSHIQVFSNGAFPVASLMLYFTFGYEAFIFGFAAGFACAISDTASSEIGTRLRHKTFYILNGRAVQPGLSGGVSWSGLLAGALFALLMGLVVAVILDRFEPGPILFISGVGFVGNLLDSIFGAALQLKYRPETSVEWVDDMPIQGRFQSKGYNWVSNEVVNMMATGCASLLGMAGFHLL